MVDMNKTFELYEGLIRLSLLLIFMSALVVGTLGLVSICQMVIRQHTPLQFVSRASAFD